MSMTLKMTVTKRVTATMIRMVTIEIKEATQMAILILEMEERIIADKLIILCQIGR